MATTWAHAVYSKESYAPFGETYNEAGTADRSFTGQDQDTIPGSGGTGVYDYLFRKYDPSAGRWLSPDPAGWNVVNGADPQSLNRYSYVENQPMNYVDPYGLTQIPCPGGLPSADNNGVLVTYGCDNGQGSGNGPEPPTNPPPTCTDFSDCQQQNPGNPSGGGAPSNGPTVSHCLGVAAADKGVSIGLDILGAIPAGNEVSAGVGIVRAGIAARKAITSPVFAVGSGVYGAYGGVTAGSENPADSLVGSASAGGGIGLTLADASLEGTRAIPLVGNAVSLLTLGWDGYQAYKKYQSCMAGH